MCGSTLTISTTKTSGPNSSMFSSTTSSIGTSWQNSLPRLLRPARPTSARRPAAAKRQSDLRPALSEKYQGSAGNDRGNTGNVWNGDAVVLFGGCGNRADVDDLFFRREGDMAKDHPGQASDDEDDTGER